LDSLKVTIIAYIRNQTQGFGKGVMDWMGNRGLGLRVEDKRGG